MFYILEGLNDAYNSFSFINIYIKKITKMAKKKESTGGKKIEKVKVKRPGTHSKKTQSNLKSSKNYKKKYRGQGR
jgi:hypothetical protein